MTPFFDPVVVAALVAGLLPILPGLPCPTCGGKRWLRAPAPYDEVLPGRSCPDCTDGVWTPPEHPVPIGVTSAEPTFDQSERLQELDADIDLQCDGREVWSMVARPHGEEWNSGNTVEYPIVLSSMIGEGTLRTFKVIDGERLDQDLTPELVCIDRHGLSHYGPLLSNRRDISSALPFFPGLKPGDTVYLLDGFTEAISCAECDGWMCKRCSGTGWERPCPFPVDAPDHPCVLVA